MVVLCIFGSGTLKSLAQIPDAYHTADSLLNSPNDSLRFLAYTKLATNSATFNGDFAAADSLLARARAIDAHQTSDYLKAMLLFESGVVETVRENFPAATRLLQGAYDGFKKANAQMKQVQALTRLDMAYFNAGEYELAKKYALQARDLLENNPSLPRDLLGHNYNELSNIYGITGNQAESLKYINKALAIYDSVGDEGAKYVSLFNSGIILRKMGRPEESLARFRQFETFVNRIKDDYYLASFYGELPNTLLDLKQNEEALRVNDLGFELLRKNPAIRNFELLQAFHTNAHKIYAAKNDYQKAYEHYRFATQYTDSLSSLDKKKEIARLETQFETKHKEERIAELDALSEARQKQVLILGAFLLALLAFLALFYWQYRRLQRSKEKISEQSEQMKLLMKELHHRVKNNLAIVSSLLKLQSNRIGDESAAKAVREGQQRVEAMSLIHQRLYQTDLLTSINMRDYIVDLCENLMTAYGYARDNFDLQLDIEREELDVDLAIPLGLILNELLTNAFKYAYHDVQRPMLTVSLTGKRDLTLEIKDNGPGIDQAEWQQKTGSFGKRLIKNLSDQIGGKYQIDNDEGTHYQLHISEESLRKAA